MIQNSARGARHWLMQACMHDDAWRLASSSIFQIQCHAVRDTTWSEAPDSEPAYHGRDVAVTTGFHSGCNWCLQSDPEQHTRCMRTVSWVESCSRFAHTYKAWFAWVKPSIQSHRHSHGLAFEATWMDVADKVEERGQLGRH